MKKVIIMSLATLLLLSGCSYLPTFLGWKETYDNDTYVGNENISGKTKEETTKLIKSMIQEWKKQTTITLLDHETNITIPKESFSFQVEKTVESIQHHEENEMVVTINMNQVKSLLEEQLDGSVYSSINFAQLQRDLEHFAQAFVEDDIYLQLGDYFPEQPFETVSNTSLPIPVEYADFVEQWVEQHKNVQVMSQTPFSMNALIEDSDVDGTDSEWSFLATAIYKVILPTNFDILKRTPNRSLPSYTTLGQDVKVSPDRMDFVFQNRNDHDYTIAFSSKENRLYVDLIGQPFPYTYEIEVENVVYYETEPIVTYTAEMEKGIYYTEKKGVAAVSADIYRKVFAKSGTFVKKEIVASQFYPGISGREVHGTKKLQDTTVLTPDENSEIGIIISKEELKSLLEAGNKEEPEENLNSPNEPEVDEQ
ncbi:VanW family protein [Bacillus sp. FJAT-47783]|uniref:VanW family protein n=1 Tax=Bacillus sp. FJAT-47783 TaxID=2922712 RepID=UPI001FAC6140|nr:VanW family protein [Bacillus sp. FJAT-47783]